MTTPTVEELLADLIRIGQIGVAPTRLPDLPGIGRLAIVGVAAPGSTNVDVALGVAAVLKEAVAELGDGPGGAAVRLYLGLVARSRGLRQRDRRELAAEAIDIDRETWRKHWEKPLLKEVAVELYRIEHERAIQVRVRPKRRPNGSVLHDFAAAGGKTLDKREAEARLLSTAYALRADLLAAEIADSAHDDTRWSEFTDTAFWRYAILAEALARYTTNYGEGLVLLGNEVTVQEVTSLLGWRGPFEDEQILALRLLLVESENRSRAAFLRKVPTGLRQLWENHCH